jgi:curved DNA-binding protein CbpA
MLGLSEGQSYTLGDIKKAFREQALTAHPDTGGDPAHFRQLQAAYEDLLCEYRFGEKGLSTDASSSRSRGDAYGSGFYAHADAQWTDNERSHRDYWRQMHEEELNMNTNKRGSPEHPSNTHYRARPHQHTYGKGLGGEFASATQAHRGPHSNFSTYYFYRPYESDYRTPYGTGFTDEEIQRAAREQRKGMLRQVARHTCLWSGLALVVFLHERHNRVRRATEAREKGYSDPAYWTQLREEEEEAKKHHRAPLRLENHWLDAPVMQPLFGNAQDDVSSDKERETAGGNAPISTESTAAQNARRMQERRLRALRPMGGGGAFGGGGGGTGGPRVVSFQGRPFTPNGVRGTRNTPPITAKTYANDVTYDASDLDWEEEE